MRSWIQFVIRNRRTVIAVSLLISLGFLFQFKSLSLVMDHEKILPQAHPFVSTSQKIQDIFGNRFLFVIGLTAKDETILSDKHIARVNGIVDRLSKSPGYVRKSLQSIAGSKAKSIESDAEGMSVRPLIPKSFKTPEDVEAVKKSILNNPVYLDLLISQDFKTTQIAVEFQSLPGGVKEVEKYVLDAVEPARGEDVEINVGGLPVFLALIERLSERMVFLFPLALVVIGLIHYEAFRSMQALFLPLVTALLAVTWGLGCLVLLGESMDVFNSATPILILAVAAGHAVQILKRYYEEFAVQVSAHPGKDKKELSIIAVEESLTKIGPVMVAAGIVAALGFFSLIVFEVSSIRNFGIFTGFGIVAALILELTFIPALRCMLSPPGEREIGRENANSIWDRLAKQFYNLAVNRRPLIFALTLGLALFSIVGGYFVKVDNSLRDYVSPNVKERIQDDKLNSRMAGASPMYILVEGSQVDDIKRPDVLKAMDQLQTDLSHQPTVGKTISIVDFIKQMNRAMNEGKPEFSVIPDDQNLIAQYLLMYSNSGSPEDFDAYIDYDYKTALVQAYSKTDSSVIIAHLVKVANDSIAKNFPKDIKVSLGGVATNSVALNDVMIRDKILNIVQIIFAVFVITAIVFRSFSAGLLVLVPVIAAVIVNFGLMGWVGIKLQIATALVSAMAVGIGADYGIYMSYRLREELAKGGNEAEALRKAFLSAGKAVLFVSSAVAGGFGVMMLSADFYVHVWLGFLIAVAMVTSSVASLTVFPALVLLFRPKYIFGNRK